MTAELERLRDIRKRGVPWRKWGPYLRERQWGIGLENEHDDSLESSDLSYEEAAYSAYEWGEDGLAGICDEQMRLCFGLALWNGRDTALKERLSPAPSGDGNEPSAEELAYLDNVPTHSYMRALYKYGCFDVFIEYAKAAPEDILIRVTVDNRGRHDARLHVLPQLWFRNTWQRGTRSVRPFIARVGSTPSSAVVVAIHPSLGRYYWQCEDTHRILFTDNETVRTADGKPGPAGSAKNSVAEYFINGRRDAVETDAFGTKAAAAYELSVAANHTQRIRLRLSSADPCVRSSAFTGFDTMFRQRRREADEFHKSLSEPSLPRVARTARQAYAGALWNKQAHLYAIASRSRDCCTPQDDQARRAMQLKASIVISTPSTWQAPRFTGMDFILHTLVLARVDPELAFAQLALATQGAHSLASSPTDGCDISVRAWASLLMFRLQRSSDAERAFIELRHAFNSLSTQEPHTSWSALHALSMFEISYELALLDKQYEQSAIECYFRFFSTLAEIDGASRSIVPRSSHSLLAHDVPALAAPAVELCTYAAALFPTTVAQQLPRFVDHVCSLSCEVAGPFRHFTPMKTRVIRGRRVLSIADEPTLYGLLANIERRCHSWTRGSGDLRSHVLLLRSLVWLHRSFGSSVRAGEAAEDTLWDLAIRFSQRAQTSLLRQIAATKVARGSSDTAELAHWGDLIGFYELAYSARNGAGRCWTSLVAPLLCLACDYQVVRFKPKPPPPILTSAVCTLQRTGEQAAAMRDTTRVAESIDARRR